MGVFSSISAVIQESAAAIETVAQGVNEYAGAFKVSGQMANESMLTYHDEIKNDRVKAQAEAKAAFKELLAAQGYTEEQIQQLTAN